MHTLCSFTLYAYYVSLCFFVVVDVVVVVVVLIRNVCVVVTVKNAIARISFSNSKRFNESKYSLNRRITNVWSTNKFIGTPNVDYSPVITSAKY